MEHIFQIISFGDLQSSECRLYELKRMEVWLCNLIIQGLVENL